MSYQSKADFTTANDGRYTAGVKKWDPVEQQNHFSNLRDSVQWLDAEAALTDGATVVWDYSGGGEKSLTIGGNRTLSITNLPTDRVSYGCLRVTQDGAGGRTLTLPSPAGTTIVGSLDTAAGAESYITFRYNGTKFRFNIS